MSYRRRVLVVIGLLAVVLVGVVATSHYRARWAVARYERQLRAAGEKLNIEELIPPPIPPESNGAPVFMQSIGASVGGTNLLDDNAPAAMQMVAAGKAIVGWAQPDVRTGQTNTWGEIEAALGQYRGSLDLVRAAAAFRRFDFRLAYRQGPSLLLPHLAPLKRSTQRLTTSALCGLHRGDVAAAVADVETILALVRANDQEHLAISQLVRIAMAHIGIAATWEVLQSPDLKDEQLAAIQRDWTQQDFIQAAEESLEFERAFGQMTLERMRASGKEFRQVLSLGGGGSGNVGLWFGQTGDQVVNEIVTQTRETRWRLALSYPDQLRALKGCQVLLDSFRQVRAGECFDTELRSQQARLAELGLQVINNDSTLFFDPSGPDLRSLFSQSVLSLSRILNRVLSVEAARRMAVTAVALDRYRLSHGEYPAELSRLVPQFLSAVPRDPADGQPLRYKLGGPFLLYSIGEDGVDNGGDASADGNSDSFGWQKGRDLVWPRPATAEEISAFWEKKTGKRAR